MTLTRRISQNSQWHDKSQQYQHQQSQHQQQSQLHQHHHQEHQRDQICANDSTKCTVDEGQEEGQCCTNTPTTSAASAHHRMGCVDAIDGRRTPPMLSSTPRMEPSSYRRHSGIIHRLSPIRPSLQSASNLKKFDNPGRKFGPIRKFTNSNSTGNDIYSNTFKATVNSEEVSRRESLNSFEYCQDSSFTSWNGSYNSSYRGVGTGNDAWPSVVNVLETPERVRAQRSNGAPLDTSFSFSSASSHSSTASSIFSSPPSRKTRNVLEMMKSPPILRTPKASHGGGGGGGALCASNVHVSSSPMSAFFYRRGVLSSNENLAKTCDASPKSTKKFVGMRFSGSQITRNNEACLLPVEIVPEIIDATLQLSSLTASTMPSITKSVVQSVVAKNISNFTEDSQLSEDSGISTFFLSTSAQSPAGAQSDSNASALSACDGSKVVLPPSVNNSTKKPRRDHVSIETPSKGLTNENYSGDTNNDSLITGNTNPMRQLLDMSGTSSPCKMPPHSWDVPEITSGPLEAEIYYTSAWKRRNSPQKQKTTQSHHTRQNQQRCGAKFQRYAILPHKGQRKISDCNNKNNNNHRLFSSRPANMIFIEENGSNLLSLEQLDGLKESRLELIAAYEFFVANHSRLTGTSADQKHISVLARAFLKAHGIMHRTRFMHADAIMMDEESVVGATRSLSAGASSGLVDDEENCPPITLDDYDFSNSISNNNRAN